MMLWHKRSQSNDAEILVTVTILAPDLMRVEAQIFSDIIVSNRRYAARTQRHRSSGHFRNERSQDETHRRLRLRLRLHAGIVLAHAADSDLQSCT